MREILCLVAQFFVIALLVRIVLSWFPLRPGGFVANLAGMLSRVTDPVLEPVRRVMPPLGPIDLSPFVVLLFVQIVVMNLVLNCASIR
jgi:YggT family protein